MSCNTTAQVFPVSSKKVSEGWVQETSPHCPVPQSPTIWKIFVFQFQLDLLSSISLKFCPWETKIAPCLVHEPHRAPSIGTTRFQAQGNVRETKLQWQWLEGMTAPSLNSSAKVQANATNFSFAFFQGSLSLSSLTTSVQRPSEASAWLWQSKSLAILILY